MALGKYRSSLRS